MYILTTPKSRKSLSLNLSNSKFINHDNGIKRIHDYERKIRSPRRIAFSVNRANFSRCWPFLATWRAILSKIKSHGHSTCRINVTSTRRPIRLHRGSMRFLKSREKKKEGKEEEEEEGSNVAETAKRIRWISGRVVSRKIDPASKPAGRFASPGDCFGATVKYGINVLLHRGSRTVFPPPPSLHLIFSTELLQQRSIFSPCNPWLRRTFRCYWSKRGGVMRP